MKLFRLLVTVIERWFDSTRTAVRRSEAFRLIDRQVNTCLSLMSVMGFVQV